MRKIFLTIFCMLFLMAYSSALKGGVTEEYIPDGFFGSWGVISKLNSSNNPDIFNYESRDIWMLSGHGNILILENLESKAHGEIKIKDKSKNNSLKFDREKIVEKNGRKIIYKESVSFVLYGNTFSGYDNFIVETYENGKQIKKDIAKYNVSGVKISGDSPKF